MRVEQEKTNIPLHQVFLQIVTDFGEDVVKDNRLISLLSDLGGNEFNQYKFIVRCSVDKGVGTQILEMKNLDEADRMLKIGNLKQSLIDEYSLQEDKVNYIFDCFLFAIGFITDIEKSVLKNTSEDFLELNISNKKEDEKVDDSPQKQPYIKIEDPSLVNLPIFKLILDIIRAVTYNNSLNEYSRLNDNLVFYSDDWYYNLPEKIQNVYGIRPILPNKERFETIGDLIKYIIHKNELKNDTVKTKEKKKKTALILALILGTLGIHKFYLGKNIAGLAYLILCTTGISLILALIDIISLLFMDELEFNKKYNLGI